MGSFFIDKCKIKVIFENRIVGETIQNNYSIHHQSNRIELLETISSNLVIENFEGRNFEFACALACQMSSRYGKIQLAHLRRFKDPGLFELVVYYSNSDVIDADRKEQIIFYHSQNGLDFEYLNSAVILQSSNSYLDILSSN